MMNHTRWFETRRQMYYHVIYVIFFLINLIWITKASILQDKILLNQSMYLIVFQSKYVLIESFSKKYVLLII